MGTVVHLRFEYVMLPLMLPEIAVREELTVYLCILVLIPQYIHESYCTLGRGYGTLSNSLDSRSSASKVSLSSSAMF